MKYNKIQLRNEITITIYKFFLALQKHGYGERLKQPSQINA